MAPRASVISGFVSRRASTRRAPAVALWIVPAVEVSVSSGRYSMAT